MFNIFAKYKPFQGNDKNLKTFYWLGIIALFLGLLAGILVGLIELFVGEWWVGLLAVGGTVFGFFVAYVAFMVFIGFLVDIKTIRNKLYSLENNNKEFYDDENEAKISKETEELYRSPREEKHRKEQQGMSKSLRITLVVICLLVLVGAIIGGIIVS